MLEQEDKSEFQRLYSIIENLEKRIVRVENKLNLESEEISNSAQTELIEPESGEDIEFRLGEKWFGKIGIIVFLLAVINFLVFPIVNFSQSLVLAVGFSISLIMIIGSETGKDYLKNLSGYILGGGLVLLYLSILRLKYFSNDPIVNDQMIIVILLFTVGILALILALKNNSASLTFISIMLIYCSALFSNTDIIFFLVIFALSFGIIFIGRFYKWNYFPLSGIILTYLTLILWLLNNPFVSGKIMLSGSFLIDLFLVTITVLLFGIANALQVSESDNNNCGSKISIANSLGAFILFLTVLTGTDLTKSGYLFTVLSIALFILAILHWNKQKSKLSTFIYSMLAYASLSVAIVSFFDRQNALILLCWQSLIVVSTALWFRSKFIVITNFFIFIIILFTSIFGAPGLRVASINLGVVALISARVINWQKERLELKTENLRNAYLMVAFIIFPLIIFNNVSSQLIGIVLIGLSLFYYVVGILIDNKKYRLMATGNLIIALGYIVLFGFMSDDTTYKVFSFFLASVTLIVVSIVYSKVRSKEKKND